MGENVMLILICILLSCGHKQSIAKVDVDMINMEAVYIPDGYKGSIVAVPFDYDVF